MSITIVLEVNDVFRFLKCKSFLWKDFGKEMHIEDSFMAKVENDSRTDDVRLEKIIEKWLEKGDSSWDGFMQILVKLNLTDLVQEVKIYLLSDN